MMETEEKYKIVIVDDERAAIDVLRRELEPYREFEVKGIADDPLPAMKICGLLIPGTMSATIGFLSENSKIKKWNPAETDYKTNKTGIICLFICVIMYGFMCVV